MLADQMGPKGKAATTNDWDFFRFLKRQDAFRQNLLALLHFSYHMFISYSQFWKDIVKYL